MHLCMIKRVLGFVHVFENTQQQQEKFELPSSLQPGRQFGDVCFRGRLRAPPATHGQEDLVASALERCNSYPCQEATLTFDCDQLHVTTVPRK
jgi:hypothetical protein